MKSRQQAHQHSSKLRALSQGISEVSFQLREALRSRNRPTPTKRFVRFLRQRESQLSAQGPVLLLHGNTNALQHVGISGFLPALKEAFPSRTVYFLPQLESQNFGQRYLVRTLDWIAKISGDSFHSVFRALGARECVRPKSSRRDLEVADRFTSELKSRGLTRQSLEALEVEGIPIGDLIYDHYLRTTGNVTIDFGDERLFEVIQQAVQLVLFWNRFFRTKTVSVLVGVDVYLDGVPSRVAMSRKIPVFQTELNIQKLTLNPDQPTIYANYPAEFKRIAEVDALNGLEHTRTYLHNYLRGDEVLPRFGASMSSFRRQGDDHHAPLPPKRAPRVLIAPHNPFSDSPHAGGGGLFSDYGEWLEFIGQQSSVLDFEWLVKVHPDNRYSTVHDKNLVWIKSFLNDFPRIQLLDTTISHSDLIMSGIDCVLTVSGSIAFEYAMAGIPTVNSSVHHPHVGYDFTITPKTKQELAEKIAQIGHLNFSPDKHQIVEYCFMHFFWGQESPFFPNLSESIQNIGHYDNWVTPAVYEEFMNGFDSINSRDEVQSLMNFIDSGDSRWYPRHRDSNEPLWN